MQTMNHTPRQGEMGEVPSRHDRFVERSNYWYYRTREGVDIGPFDNRQAAEFGCTEFIDLASHKGQEFSKTLCTFAA